MTAETVAVEQLVFEGGRQGRQWRRRGRALRARLWRGIGRRRPERRHEDDTRKHDEIGSSGSHRLQYPCAERPPSVTLRGASTPAEHRFRTLLKKGPALVRERARDHPQIVIAQAKTCALHR